MTATLRVYSAASAEFVNKIDPKEVTRLYGLSDEGSLVHVNYPQVKVANPAFDITPKELISGIITEKGIFKPDELKAIYE